MISFLLFSVIPASASVRSIGSSASIGVIGSRSPLRVRCPRGAVSVFSDLGWRENTGGMKGDLSDFESGTNRRRPTSHQTKGNQRRPRCLSSEPRSENARNIFSYWAKRLQTQIFLRRQFTHQNTSWQPHSLKCLHTRTRLRCVVHEVFQWPMSSKMSNDLKGGWPSTWSNLPVVIDRTSWSGFAVFCQRVCQTVFADYVT